MALEGRHYSRGTRLHKQTMEALLCFKSKKLEESYAEDFVLQLKNLRDNTTHVNLLAVCKDSNFQTIQRQLLDHSGTMGTWIVEYIRDVSCFL